MVGNVWEWTSSQWCSNIDPVSGAVTELEDYRPAGPGEEQLSRRPPPECLRAAVDMNTRTEIMNNVEGIEYIKKGGSFISQRDRDFRHRSAARDKSAANTSAQHIGARCVYDHMPAWAVDLNSA
jgi:formylglycine-generating enzyme required for sulfatase activity